jgi:hypothetical protein
MYIGAEGTSGPADTVPFGTDWSTGIPAWYHPGYSQDGLTLQVDRKEKRHKVDEISSPAVITVDETTMKVLFKFAEATLENLRYAVGGGTITTVAASTGVIGKKTLKISENLDVVTLGFEGKNPQGFFRRVVIPRVVSVGKIKTEWDRSKNMQVFAAEFESVCSIEDVLIYDKTANALA